MKNPLDPRHKKRQKAVEDLYKYEFHKQNVSDYSRKIIEKRGFLDKQISISAPQFPIEKINKVDLAILRLAFFELLIGKTQPVKVIIDEAIELAKEYGGQKSPAFINGALANLIKDDKHPKV